MLYLLNFNYDSNKKLSGLVFVFFLMTTFNIMSLAKIYNLILTIPQFLTVLYLLFNNKMKDAVLWHFTFVMLSLSVQGTLGMFESKDFLMYNYASVKLIGPIRASYLINIIMLIIIILDNKKHICKQIQLYKLYRVLWIVGGMASIIGILGLIFHPYYSFPAFLDQIIYMFVVLSSLYILLCNADERMYRCAYYLGLCSIIAGCYASLFGYYFLDVRSLYGIFEIVYTADIVLWSPLLILGILYEKRLGLVLSGLVCFLIISSIVLGGKTVFGIVFCLICLIYCLFFDKDVKDKYSKRIIIMRPLIVILFIWFVTFSFKTSDSMTAYKVESAISMFSGNLDDVSRSPYIRIASLMNIIHEGLNNIFTFIFGNGYGGYFEDKLNLFANLNLENGAWHGDDLNTGRYHSGHDTMVTVPLYNGVLGVILLIKICISYLKRIRLNYFCAMAFLWILLMFYVNTIYAYSGTFLLFAAHYNLRKYNTI